MVSYGGLSGETIGFSTGQLIRKCLTVSGFNTQSQHPDNMLRAGRDLMGWLAEGKLQVIVEKAYPLEEAARAHAALEAGDDFADKAASDAVGLDHDEGAFHGGPPG